jgi:hypothetical protein
MPPIVTSAEIDRPAAEVFAYATDPARFSQWQKGVMDGHMDGPADGTQTPAPGDKCVTTRRIGGASRPSTSELVHIDPPRTWGVRGTDGSVRRPTAGDRRTELFQPMPRCGPVRPRGTHSPPTGGGHERRVSDPGVLPRPRACRTRRWCIVAG